MIDQELAEQVALATGLLDGRWHARAFPSRDAYELELLIDVHLAGHALRLDDDHPVLVQDQVVDLGKLALSFNAQIIAHANIGIVGVSPAQVERHLLLGSVTGLLHPVAAGAGCPLLRDHKSDDNAWSRISRIVTVGRFGQIAEALDHGGAGLGEGRHLADVRIGSTCANFTYVDDVRTARRTGCSASS